MNPLDALEQFFAEVVRQMPNDIFDSHAFILMLMKTPPRQRLYVQALARTRRDDPFRQVNGQISRRLRRHRNLVRPRRRVNSPNIFGDSNSNQEWQRL
jgi:hypothetical protein